MLRSRAQRVDLLSWRHIGPGVGIEGMMWYDQDPFWLGTKELLLHQSP